MVPENGSCARPATSAQFQIIKKLINDRETDSLICATDAGREGHIFRLIYEHARCKKPVRRLWVSSLTDEAIRAGFSQLIDGSQYDDLGSAARMRAQADWLVGMNLTRAYTVHNGVLCTIGRVQTPTLSMIVQRDREIADFKKAFFYELVARITEGFSAKYTRDGQTRIERKEEAERLHHAQSTQRHGSQRRKRLKRIVLHLLRPEQLAARCQPTLCFTVVQTLEYAKLSRDA